MSLPELLVVTGLSLLFLVIVTRFTVGGSRLARSEVERAAAEATLLSIESRFAADLADSAPAGLSRSGDGHNVSVHAVTLTDTGVVTFDDLLWLWKWDGAAAVLRRYQTVPSPSALTFDGRPIRFDEAGLAALPSPDFGVSRQYPRVSDFEVLNPPGVASPNIGSPFTLKLSVGMDLAVNRKNVVISRVYFLHSSGI